LCVWTRRICERSATSFSPYPAWSIGQRGLGATVPRSAQDNADTKGAFSSQLRCDERCLRLRRCIVKLSRDLIFFRACRGCLHSKSAACGPSPLGSKVPERRMRGPSLRPQESRPSPARPDDLRPRQSRLEYAFELVLAAVSHGLASSPPRGEGAHRRYRRSLHYCSSMPGGTLVVRTAPTWRIARAGGVRKPRDYDMAARCPHVQELQVRRITGKGCIHGSAVAASPWNALSAIAFFLNQEVSK